MPETNKQKVLFWVFILVVECVFSFTPYKVIDQELKWYVNHFNKRVEKECNSLQYYNPTQMTVTFGDLPDYTIGTCEIQLNGYAITIDRVYWQSADSDSRYQTMMHELTHCSLSYFIHSDDVNHYMYASLNSLSMETTRTQLDAVIADRCN